MATNELNKKSEKNWGRKANFRKFYSSWFFITTTYAKRRKIKALPKGLSIANDCEERYIIMEDIKAIINAEKIKESKKTFQSTISKLGNATY